MPRPLRALVAFLSLLALLVVARPGQAQPKPPPAASASSLEPIEEAADSPRVSVRSFLDLAQRGRYQDAAIYLDVPRGSERHAPELAAQLHAVLSQRLRINPEALSGHSRGRSTDGLPSPIEELGKIPDANNHPIAIRLVRHESKALDDEARWVFSQTTVAAVPGLYRSLRDRWFREHLPPALLAYGPMALAWWQWLALPLLGATCLGLGRLLAGASGFFGRRIFAKHSWSESVARRLLPPATLGWALGLFALVTPYLALTIRAEDLVVRCLRALGYLAFFWALLRVVSVVGTELARGDWGRARPSARSLSAVGVSVGKVIVAALALMFTFSELGYPVTSIVAGLGIGGVAVALAAQKTVENLFGSLSLLVDQPFRVGDTIRVDGIEGVVETVGVRSTRVRTAERTLVIFPNGKLADMRIESLGPRDRLRFAIKLQLSRTTPLEALRAVVPQLRAELAAHPRVRKEDLFVRLSGVGEASYDVDVALYVETLEWPEYARVREELVVTCIATIDKAGAKLAVPVREVALPGPARDQSSSLS